MKFLSGTIALFAGLAAPVVLATAQGAGSRAVLPQTDVRWAPFIGCWSPDDGGSVISLSGNSRSSSIVCVAPGATPSRVHIASVMNGRVVARESVDATGAPISKIIDGCAGTESAAWSRDGHRVLFRSEFRCKDSVVRKESGVFAISALGEWVDVQGVDVMGSTGVRVVRLHDIGVDSATLRYAAVSAAVGDTVVVGAGKGIGYAASTLRTAAASRLTPDDVLDVSQHVDAAVAEAWLNESGQEFKVDARSLVRLADAGLPSRMIDMLVAMSYPGTFAVVGNSGDRERANGARNTNTYGAFGSGVSPIAWGLGSCSSYDGLYSRRFQYGRSFYDGACGYGYNAYNGYNGYNRYGYGPNGYGYGYGGTVYYGNNPVVIVPREDVTRGRAVPGRGYTRDGGGGSGVGSASRGDAGYGGGSRASGSSGSTGSGAGSGTSTGTSGGSSSGGESSGRTAKARGGN